MFATISDCQILLARDFSLGAYNGLQEMGNQPIITDIPEIEKAVQAVIDESIKEHPERLH